MKSHGDGSFRRTDFLKIGQHVIFEKDVLIFHPENIEIGNDVYIGHQAILKGYYKNKLVIGEGSWIGQQVFLHAAGGLVIGKNVGMGPAVKIITSVHEGGPLSTPILHTPLRFKGVTIEDHSDIGVGTIILPGVTIGKGALVGAGSVVTTSIPPYAIAVGNPARIVKMRTPQEVHENRVIS